MPAPRLTRPPEDHRERVRLLDGRRRRANRRVQATVSRPGPWQALTVIDEAHAFGALSPCGSRRIGRRSPIDLVMGTLGRKRAAPSARACPGPRRSSICWRNGRAASSFRPRCPAWSRPLGIAALSIIESEEGELSPPPASSAHDPAPGWVAVRSGPPAGHAFAHPAGSSVRRGDPSGRARWQSRRPRCWRVGSSSKAFGRRLFHVEQRGCDYRSR